MEKSLLKPGVRKKKACESRGAKKVEAGMLIIL